VLQTSGPFYLGANATVRSLLQVGTSCTFTTTAALLTLSGLVEVATFNSTQNDTFSTGAPVITQASLVNMTNYTRANARTIVRTAFTPTDLSDYEYVDFNSIPNPTGVADFNHGEYWLFTGLPASTTVGNFKITASGNYVPLDTSVGLITKEKVLGYAATQDCQAAIAGMVPLVSRLTPDLAQSLASTLVNSGNPRYNDVLELVSRWVQGNDFKHIGLGRNVPHAPGMQPDQPGDDGDMLLPNSSQLVYG